MTDFSSLPVFVAVIESGSFSQAGKALGVSKSAVSKRINQLEERLGVQLLQRTTRRLSLTEAGERYFEYAQQALAQARAAEDAVSLTQTCPKGLLRVNAPMSFGRLHLAALVPEFLERYPQIELHMAMDDRVVDMVAGGFDVAVRIGRLQDSSLVAKRLSDCQSVLCAAPNYLERSPTLQTPMDLQNHNCLFYSYFQAGTEWTFHGLKGAVRVQPKGNYQVNNSEALREAVLAGVGVAQMPLFIVADDIRSGKLTPLLPHYPLPLHAIYAVYPQRRHLPAKVRVFLEFISEKMDCISSEWRLDSSFTPQL